MQSHLKILILEDDETDFEITKRLLLKEIKNCAVRLATNKENFFSLLDHFHHDVILCDHSLPQFNSVEAIKIARQFFPDIPFILVTGAVSEDFAIEVMKSGADDFILKDRLSRLPSAIERAIKHRKAELEKKEIQQRIIDSENNLRAIFENTSEGFLLMDTDGVVKVFNSNAAQYGFFVKGKEIHEGDNLLDFIEDSSKPAYKEILLKVLHKEAIQFERKYLSDDNTTRWIDFSITPVIEKEQKVTGICITGRDITDKKTIEKQREFDHNNLQALINNTGDLMWSVDHNLNLITCNDSFNKVVAETSGKPAQKGDSIFSEQFTKDKLTRYKEFYIRALSGETFTINDHFETPRELWSEVSFNPIYSYNEIIGVACFSRDITHKKIVEGERERLSSIIETTSDFVGIVDINQQIIFLNRGGREMTGFGETEDLTGISIREFLDEKNYQTVSEVSLPAALKDGKWRGELDFTARSGRKVPVSVVIVIPKTTDSEPQYLSAIARDISERKNAEANLKLMEQKIVNQKIQGQKSIARAILQAQEKERNHLGQELHDNINQILAATKLHLSFTSKNNPQQKKLLEYPIELISSAIKELKQLSSRDVTPLKNINLEELILKIVEELKKNTSLKINFIFNVRRKIDDDLKLNVYRIIQEQMNNIIKHAKAKNISILIESVDEDLHVQVADDGKGFNIRKKSKGIGISNITNRIESFNGKLKIITSPGKGCHTDIFIPFKGNGVVV